MRMAQSHGCATGSQNAAVTEGEGWFPCARAEAPKGDWFEGKESREWALSKWPNMHLIRGLKFFTVKVVEQLTWLPRVVVRNDL